MGNALVPGQRGKMKFSEALQTETYKRLIRNTLQDPDKERRFVGAIQSAVAANPLLQECTAGSILACALLGESLNLSPSPQLGEYYLVPFKVQLKDSSGNKLWAVDEKGNRIKDERGRFIPVTETRASFVCGYKGLVQLTLRSDIYKTINVREVKAGELKYYNPFDETIEFEPIQDVDKRMAAPTIGYYAVLETLKGFQKRLYWSRAMMIDHADKYSPAFNKADFEKYASGEYDKKDEWRYSSYWYKNFDAMAKKTMLRQLLLQWGVKSIEMQEVLVRDEQTTQLVGNDVVTEEIDALPEPVAPIPASDMRPEFEDVGGRINLEDI